MLKQSRFEEFNTSLIRIVTSKQLKNVVNKTILSMRRVVSRLDSQNEKNFKHFIMKQDLLNFPKMQF